MKRLIPSIVLSLFLSMSAMAQCSLCTKTAQDLEHNAAKGLNVGIIYLALMPISIITVIGILWWRNYKTQNNTSHGSSD